MDANLKEHGWELESAVACHQQHPGKFNIPSEEERTHLRVGDLVKLLFLLSGTDETGAFVQGERMWVTVQTVAATRYTGMLESLPESSTVLQPGDIVTFTSEHVAAIFVPKTDPRHPDYVPEQSSNEA